MPITAPGTATTAPATTTVPPASGSSAELIQQAANLYDQAQAALKAGDLGAVVKLRDTHTGDTLCSPKRPVVLRPRGE